MLSARDVLFQDWRVRRVTFVMRRMSNRSTGRLALVGLLSLLVVDAFLVSQAIQPDAAGAASKPASSASTAASSASGVQTAPIATSTQALVRVVPLSEVISAVDGQRAWRASLGSCQAGGATLSVTTDGGRTWIQRATPAVVLGRVQPVAGSKGFIIGARAGACRAGEYSTSDDAANWQGPRAIEGGWSRVPGGDPVVVIAPKQTEARPCGTKAVVDLARVSAVSAVVVCEDGRLAASHDGGATWPTLATVEGTLAVGAREVQGAMMVAVARVVQGCPGVEIATVASGSANDVSCVQTALEGAAGRVSLSIVGDGGWLVVGTATWRSNAKLHDWRPSS